MFICSFCDFKSVSFNQKLKHRLVHRAVSSRFHCDFKGCKRVCSSEGSLRCHLVRFHAFRASYAQCKTPPLAAYKCKVDLCHTTCGDYRGFRKHIKKHFEENVQVPCPFQPCLKSYKSEASFRSHLSKCHRVADTFGIGDSAFSDANPSVSVNRNQSARSNESPSVPVSQVQSALSQSSPVNDGNKMPLQCFSGCESGCEMQVDDLERSAALFFLKLESIHLVPASTVQCVVEEIRILSELNKAAVQKKLTRSLEDKNVSPALINSIVDDVGKASGIFFNHEKLGSTFLRRKYFAENFSYNEPRKYFFKDVDGNNTDRFFYYVPILQTIRLMFKDEDVRQQYENPTLPRTNLLVDFTDGSAFKSNKLFGLMPDALQPILYVDAFEIVNPLGSAKQKHKIMAAYMMLGNTRHDWRSRASNIQLVALCKEKEYIQDQFFAPVVEDLKQLETEGIALFPGKVTRGTVPHICGDNLGSHELCGINCNFNNAEYFCRYCLISRKDFVPEFPFAPRRTIENYQEGLQNLENNKTSSSEVKGVKHDSALNKLEFYHVINGLPPCLAHDLFEGVVAYDLALCINALVKKGWFTISYINKKIDAFKYSPEDLRDKPARLKERSEKISGSACQIWAFIRLLPLFVGTQIKDPNEEVWKLILSLREIVLLLCAPEVSRHCLAYLDHCVVDYLCLRATIFPNKPLRPKHHYLQHYAELTLEFGPLVKIWTLRFESKHKFFKRVVRSCQNFINVLMSLAIKHELSQGYYRAGGGQRPPFEVKNEVPLLLELLGPGVQNALKVIQNSPLTHCDVVTVKGTDYKSGYAVITAQDEFVNDLHFGVIKMVVLDTNQIIYLLLEKLKTKYNPILQIYMVLAGFTPEYVCIKLDNLIDYQPLPLYTFGTASCVILKRGVMKWC